MKTPDDIHACQIFWHVPLPENPENQEGSSTPPQLLGRLERDGDGHLFFAYEKTWLDRRIEISPGHLPLELGTQPVSLTDPHSTGYESSMDVRNEFRGLPGPFYDSLPDKWGMTLLAKHTGKDPDSISALEILCHRGNRCMGAFSYEPATSHARSHEPISDETLNLYCQKAAQLTTGDETGTDTLAQTILDALEDSGGSVGGMRPKMLLAIRKADLSGGDPANAPTMRKLAGYDYSDMPPDFEPWLLKFDTHPGECRGLIEKAFADMAVMAGVSMPRTTLIRTSSPQGEHAHFATLRFDRQIVGGQWHRVHMHTAAGLLRKDFNQLDLDYTDLLELTRILTGDAAQVRQVYTRAVFNVLAGNSDDHAKNHAFLLNHTGKWEISPAYDLTPSKLRLLPDIRSTSILGNKREAIPLATLTTLAEQHNIKDSKEIIQQVADAIKQWPKFAEDQQIPRELAGRYKTRMKNLLPEELKSPTGLKKRFSKNTDPGGRGDFR